MLYLNFISHWLSVYEFNMLVTYGDGNYEIYEYTKTKVPIIVEFYNNTSNMHIFTTIHIILKLYVGKQNKIVGIWEKM